MPAIGTAIAGVITAFKATALGTFLTKNLIGRLLLSAAISGLQAALAPKPKTPGIVTETTLTGSTNPLTFIVGTYATAGQLACPMMSHGKVNKTPNAYRTYVVTLGCIPGQTLSQLMINGEYVTLGSTPHADYGLPVMGDFEGYAWVKYYDGTQTVADPMLMAKYADYPERPWQSDMVLTGFCYAILTFRFKAKIWTSGEPSWRFEMDGIPLYDPREDSTAPGGSGPQRWSNPATWTLTHNNLVISYNIMRGITVPDLGIWGGRIEADDVPLSSWFAAMNKCDVLVTRPGGATEPKFRAGYEIKLTEEPASVIEELFRASATQIAEVGGIFKVRTGGPGLPVYYMSDADVMITSPQELDPFPGADSRFNGVTGQGPDPEMLWEARPVKAIYNATWEAEDGGKRRVAALQLPACPYPLQIQRVMRAYIKDERRFRRHNLTLPPDAAVLEPLDTLGWTSERNGYSAKAFEIAELHDDVLSVLQNVAIREVDPTDYDDPPEYGEPHPAVSVIHPRRAPQVLAGFDVVGGSHRDATNAERRPHLRLFWDATEQDGVQGVEWEVRLAANQTMVHRGATTDVEGGDVYLGSGILPQTDYEARARQVAKWRVAWSAWKPATTPNVRIGEPDIEQQIIDRIEEADRVVAAYDALVLGFEGTLDAALTEATALANAGLEGWVKDAVFTDWSGSPLNLTAVNWASRSGTSAYAVEGGGDFGGGMLVDAPAGTSLVEVIASTAAGLIRANATADYVVQTLHVDYLAGNPSGAFARVEWSNDGTTWTRGMAFGVAANYGSFAALGLAPNPGVRQAVQVLWQRPAGVSGHMRQRLIPKIDTVSDAQNMRIHLCNLGPASQAQIDAGQVYTVASAVPGETVAVAGIGAAMVQFNASMTARVGANEAAIATTQTALADAEQAVASVTQTVAATAGVGTAYFRDTFGGDLSMWEIMGGTGEVAAIASTEGIGAKILRLGNSSGDDLVTIAHKHLIPFDPAKLYKATVSARRSAGTGGVNIGFLGIAADGVTLVNTTGAPSLSSQHKHVANAAPLTASFAEYAGYTKGRATPGIGVPGLVADPAEMHTDVRYLRPFISANVTSLAGIAEFAHFTVDDGMIADLPGEVMVQSSVISSLTDQTTTAKYIVRVTTIGGEAYLEFASTDDPDGPATTIKLKTDNLLIDSSNVLIANYSNLITNSDLVNSRGWYFYGGAAHTSAPPSNSSAPGNISCTAITSGEGMAQFFKDNRLPVRPGDEFHLTAGFRASGTTPLFRTRIVVWQYDRAGTYVSAVVGGIVDLTSVGYTPVSMDYTVPAGVASVIVGFGRTGVAGSLNTGYIENPFIQKKIGATLVVDGLLITSSAQVGTAVIGTAQIADASITSAEIATAAVGSAEIATAAITTAKIGDLQVSTIKVIDNAITNGVGFSKTTNTGSNTTQTRNMTISCAGGTPVSLWIKGSVTATSGTLGTVSIKAQWNGVDIISLSQTWGSSDPRPTLIIDEMVTRTSTSGTNTLTLECTCTTGFSREFGQAVAIEMKK